MDKTDKIWCETHKCTISVNGCLLRQQRNNGNPQAWMYNKIPGDPQCENCAQGKQVKKGKYTIYKEDIMEKTKERTCRICGKPFPETKEYFYTHNSTKDGWDTRCKECVKQSTKKQDHTKAYLATLETALQKKIAPKEKKTCSVCGATYPATKKYFRGHNATKDKLENRCRECVGKKNNGNVMQLDFSNHTALLDKLKKMAYAEYRTPELQIMAMIEKEA